MIGESFVPGRANLAFRVAARGTARMLAPVKLPRLPAALMLLVFGAPVFLQAQAPAPKAPAAHPAAVASDPIARIRDEGLNRSQVMATLAALTDLNGPRLTGSPGLQRAREWSRDRFTTWGLANAQLEP